mgnify:CR=1 FL=1
MKEGQIAPDFELSDATGKKHSLHDYRGKKVVLYFYPKDNTPGCTKQACGFAAVYDQIQKKGAITLGVSADSSESHKKFVDKYNLPFTLLSDKNKEVIKLYDALKQKSMFGNTFLGIIRKTVVIDDKGKIIKIFPKVSPEGHAQEILQLL